MQRHIIIKFHEIALKGRNRPMFIRQLMDNLRTATKGTGITRIWKGQMMIGLDFSEDYSWDKVKHRVMNCFGVAKFFRAYSVSPEIEKVKSLIVDYFLNEDFKTFRITSNRADKNFTLNSSQLNQELGAFVQEYTHASVKLKNPDMEIFVDVIPNRILVYSEELPGHGGLPVGVSGKALAMLSGGIDSPVAAWHMMKRGCQVTFVHFHSYPVLDSSSIEKATELSEWLTRSQYSSSIFLVPLADIQKSLLLSTPPPYRIVLYRRFMLRIAQDIAMSTGIKALVTGESLGQVSSQTLENILAVDNVVNVPVFRPLIGLNKQEIIDKARDIGTYNTSIIPDQDCCTLFVPRNPVIHSNLDIIERLESTLDVANMAQDAIKRTEVRSLTFP